jgi:predicted NAD/FAD-binding protein
MDLKERIAVRRAEKLLETMPQENLDELAKIAYGKFREMVANLDAVVMETEDDSAVEMLSEVTTNEEKIAQIVEEIVRRSLIQTCLEQMENMRLVEEEGE